MYSQYPNPLAMAMAGGRPLCVSLCSCMADCAHAHRVEAALSHAMHRVWGLSSAPANTKQHKSRCCCHAHVIWHLCSVHALSWSHRLFLLYTCPVAKPPQQNSPLHCRGLTLLFLSLGSQVMRRHHLLPQRDWQHQLGTSSQSTPPVCCSIQWPAPTGRRGRMRPLQGTTTSHQRAPCSSRRRTSSSPLRMSTSTPRRCRAVSQRMQKWHCCAACGPRGAPCRAVLYLEVSLSNLVHQGGLPTLSVPSIAMCQPPRAASCRGSCAG